MGYEKIQGGVCAPLGFQASGMHCGLRKNKSKYDLAVIAADHLCAAAAVYTTNRVYAAPVGVTKAHMQSGFAQAMICNSSNANTCNADGYEKAEKMCEALADALKIKKEDVIVASTGVIGVPLPIEPILSGIPKLVEKLGKSEQSAHDAAIAIMTTDTRKKEYAVSFELGGKTVKIGGICKGSGMIHPDMATMLGFITTDAAITPQLLQKALTEAIGSTFNMISVDRDTSTNDMVAVLASADAGNALIDTQGDDYALFTDALTYNCRRMAKAVASDGEGATRLLECHVGGAGSESGARTLAKSVITSPLVKTAMYGADANWGRILCALGYAGVDFDPSKVGVSLRSKAGEIEVCKNGSGVPFDEDTAKQILSKDYIIIEVDMKSGNGDATAWGCDLTYEYVRINGDYRS